MRTVRIDDSGNLYDPDPLHVEGRDYGPPRATELRAALPLAIVVALVAWLLVAALFVLLGR
jgi:hypothetical protein